MGSEHCGCNRPPHESEVTGNTFKPTALQACWADAINGNRIDEAAILNEADGDLIHLPIEEDHVCAIHVCVEKGYHELLAFLLTQRFDVNAQETKFGDTALHIAVAKEDNTAIEKLFSYDELDVDDKLRNYDGKEAMHMCTEQYKREYIKYKERGKTLRNKLKKHNQKSSQLTAARLQKFTTQLQNAADIDYLAVNNGYHGGHAQPVLNGAYRDSRVCATKFALANGVDIDEMVLYLQRTAGTSIWTRLTPHDGDDETRELCRAIDIEHLLTALCKLTHADKYKEDSRRYNYEPCAAAIQQLNHRMCQLLGHGHRENKISLDEKRFEQCFNAYLYQIHSEILSQP